MARGRAMRTATVVVPAARVKELRRPWRRRGSWKTRAMWSRVKPERVAASA